MQKLRLFTKYITHHDTPIVGLPFFKTPWSYFARKMYNWLNSRIKPMAKGELFIIACRVVVITISCQDLVAFLPLLLLLLLPLHLTETRQNQENIFRGVLESTKQNEDIMLDLSCQNCLELKLSTGSTYASNYGNRTLCHHSSSVLLYTKYLQIALNNGWPNIPYSGLFSKPLGWRLFLTYYL
jgi:hypothetical protein